MNFLNHADPNEVINFIVWSRRKVTSTPKHQDHFAHVHGADPVDVAQIQGFLASNGFSVSNVNHSTKQISVWGTVAQIEQAFLITVNYYDQDGTTVRKIDGEPTLPDRIIAITGINTVRMRPHFAVDPPNTVPLTIDQLRTIYNFPTNSAAGQVIGVWEWAPLATPTDSDIAAYWVRTGDTPPTMIDVVPSDSGPSGLEADLDICVAGSAAPGCTLAMYYASLLASTDQQFIDSIARMIHPWPGDPVPTVISLSWGVSDAANLPDLLSPSTHNAITSIFQDAAALGITILASSGDNGTGLAARLYMQQDGLAYVEEFACNPYAVSCGGTVIGNLSGTTFEEYVWNQDTIGGNFHGIASGGGVSQFFPVPTYQTAINPLHANTNLPGRGHPDMSGSASPDCGVLINHGSELIPVGGTSQTAPLFSGLIAVINAATGRRSGFINPIIYANPQVFREIGPGTLGPPDISTYGAPGYPVKVGWDASNGLGMPIGTALRTVIANAVAAAGVVSYSDDGGAIHQISGTTTVSAFGFLHPPMPAGSHTMQIYFNGNLVNTVGYVVNAATAPDPPAVLGQPVYSIGSGGPPHGIIVTWLGPTGGNPPYSYRIEWGLNTPGSFNSGNATVTSPLRFTIDGLATSNQVYYRVFTVGPTGLLSTPLNGGPVNSV